MTTHAQFSASCFLSNFISGKGSEWKGGNPTLKPPPSMWSAQYYCSKKRIFFGLTDLEIPLFFFPQPPTLELQHGFQFRTKEKYISAESSPDAFSFSLFWALIGGGLPTGAHTQKSLFSSPFPFLGKGIFNYNPRRKERNCGDHRSSHHNLYFQT